MKSIIQTWLLTCIGLLIVSCSDLTFGDEFLGTQPEISGATIDTLFSSKENSDKVLTKAYTYLPYGLPTGGGNHNKLGGVVLENITDINHSFRGNIGDGPANLYYNGALSSSINGVLIGSEAYRYGGEVDWSAIRYSWLYIENIDKVKDMTANEKLERIAEAQVILAISYTDMLRNIGGVPWLDHAISPNEELVFPRITFEETVNNIVDLLDQAIPNLKWKHDASNDGRMDKAGALALKLRVLLFAASPTFNSGTPWHPSADTYTSYGNYDMQRWVRAKAAGKEFMDALTSNGQYALTQPLENTHQARREAYRSAYYDRGGSETLISTRRGYDEGVLYDLYFPNRYYVGPTLNYVNMFSWADGTDFPEDFNWVTPSKQPFYEGNTPTRDPRLYETVAVPGDMYFNNTPAPVYVNHPNFKNGSGFLQMKWILQTSEDRSGRPTQWPYLRLPEALLSYAEAINEADGAPSATAYSLINDIRARVGLTPIAEGLSKEQFREALLKERALELGFEEVRWYDLIRWGREQDFRKRLYGLDSKGNDQNAPTSFTFKTIELNKRFWVDNWDTKWYLSPIPQVEINKDYGMTQNPGW
ncbi:RagB/SusD family nutrient uptake outer membrane protein [Wocania ichthyoenteri]|uniref:RagB/SusD family nutrient uptake outer membrane protein n=1 Tax=Wocania ichthyoenteri TaxID=1230531 RepID=UPI00053E4F33|nr:RagB/SusD family nutrient uptake outer membrane protein [Wocania ichthyoenteri]